jgi:zinc protease
VLDTRLAQEVDASQQSGELGSVFQIDALAAPGTDLEVLKGEILKVVDELLRDGPTPEELARAQARQEARFLRRMESLLARAEAVQAYRRFFGVSDGFQRDLERWTHATREDVRGVARSVLGPGRVDLRILPALEVEPTALDQRPADFARHPFQPATPTTFRLANGIPVHFLARQGTGLFTGSLIVPGGEGVLPQERAGSALLAARWIGSGAGGRDKAAFAQAVESLGGSMGASAARSELSYECSGLASRCAETLDLLRDLVLAPDLREDDFTREKEQHLNDIRARDDDPNAVARTVGRALLFGRDDPRGRPAEGTLASVGALTKERVAEDVKLLLDPSHAAFVFAGDLDPAVLKGALEARFGAWKASPRPP